MGTFTAHELEFANSSSRHATYFPVSAAKQVDVTRLDCARDQSTLGVTGSTSSSQFSSVRAM